MTTHLTNLRPKARIDGFEYAQCLMPGHDVDVEADVILIDHEEDNDAIVEGDPKAIAEAKALIAGVRAAAKPTARLGWYGWPFPLEEADVEPLARVFSPLIELADFLAPCCYVGSKDDDRTELRGYLFDECIARMPHRIVWEMERYGVVADWTLDSKTQCTDAMVGDQVRAAVRADCDSLYLWSGIPPRVWAAKLKAPYGHPAYQAVNMARAELLGNYGFRVYSWGKREVDREYQRHAERLAKRFAGAWDEIA